MNALPIYHSWHGRTDADAANMLNADCVRIERGDPYPASLHLLPAHSALPVHYCDQSLTYLRFRVFPHPVADDGNHFNRLESTNNALRLRRRDRDGRWCWSTRALGSEA